MPEFQHQTVLRDEAITYLNIKPEGIYVDATVGGAGHTLKIAEQLNPKGVLIGIDQDRAALEAAKERLTAVTPRLELVRRNFSDLGSILKELRIAGIDGILFDLGVSSPQLDEEERGFSYKADAPLDMRMDQSQPFSAVHLVNTASVIELTKVIREYGEERWAARIASFIEEARREKAIETTGELADIVKRAIPAAARRNGPHPARRTFQAIRIAVNRELDVLQTGLESALNHLNPGGRLVIISFHSLEDRLVKSFFAEQSKGCECPRGLPVCVCNRHPRLKIITRKPVVPNAAELQQNHRARSSKLRCAEKLV
jgi:16S rRNA (cytosine1402-N4)-methyltransferase